MTAAASVRPTGVDRRAMAMLSAGHLFTDVGQGSIPALLPFLIVRDHLSYAGASALILAATIASSVIQPLFGHLSDRRSLPWLMPAGPILGGLGVALAAVAPSYALTFAAVVVSGIGVAAFHPEGSRFANYVSGARRSSGMSLFSVGGNVGFALGPALVTPLVLVFGLSGTLLLIVPTSLMGLVLARELPRLETFRVDLTRARATAGTDEWRPFTLLALVIALRSFVYFGFVTFIPLYFIHVLHTGRGVGGAALTVMLVGGAIGTLLGGRLADRFGRRSVLIGSMAVLPFLTAGFLVSPPGAGDGVRRGGGRGDHRDVRGHDRHGPGVPAGADRCRLGGHHRARRSAWAASARRCWASSPTPTGCARCSSCSWSSRSAPSRLACCCRSGAIRSAALRWRVRAVARPPRHGPQTQRQRWRA